MKSCMTYDELKVGMEFTNNNGEAVTVVGITNSMNIAVSINRDRSVVKNVRMERLKSGDFLMIKHYPVLSIGQKFVSKSGNLYKVVEYVDKYNVTIETQYGTIITTRQLMVEDGRIYDPYEPSNSTNGFFGRGVYSRDSESYSNWTHVLARVEKTDSTVCESWFNFQNFSKWYFENLTNTEHYSKITVDKDCMFFGNKHYSPDTCMLLPDDVNTMIQDKSSTEGSFLGVTICEERGKYGACGKRFDDLKDAIEYYWCKKLERFTRKIEKYTHLKEHLMSHYHQSKKHQFERPFDCYIAGPFFNDEEMSLVKRIELALLKKKIRFFSPRLNGIVKDVTVPDKDSFMHRIYDDNIKSINNSSIMVCIIDNHDSGTMFEYGWAAGDGKAILTITDKDYGLNIMLKFSAEAHSTTVDNLVSNVEGLLFGGKVVSEELTGLVI